MLFFAKGLSLLLLGSSVNAVSNSHLVRVLGAQGVNLWNLQKAHQPVGKTKFSKEPPAFLLQESEETQAPIVGQTFRARWFEQPLDHFSKENKRTFHQRYWVNDRYYDRASGGPVIILDGGETTGEERLPFLDTGIVEILARATGGVGVVLEHRYYGASIPVDDLTTDSLRWLNNEQAAADSANFMANVKFDGIDEDLTAPNTPWIYYGGSYAGARAAHMKVLYPELVYGSIASSAVTHASLINWEYMEIIRRSADAKCASHLENSIVTIDNILDVPGLAIPLKSLFGLRDLKHDEDFVSVLESPLGYWQSRVWDPNFDDGTFDEFCDTLTKPFGHFKAFADLPFNHSSRMVTLPGGLSVDFAIANYAKWIKNNIVSQCHSDLTLEECFGTFEDEKYERATLDQDWRLWQFQVCTQWGYFITPPPDQKHPRIISRRLTLDYESRICTQAFPPGKHFVVPSLPNITAVNAYGDFSLAADRLAFIDGAVDPWRAHTPHSEYADQREDTLLRPFKIIPGAVHHWDEYGLPNLQHEPEEIRKIHGEMIGFVVEWLKNWKAPNV